MQRVLLFFQTFFYLFLHSNFQVGLNWFKFKLNLYKFMVSRRKSKYSGWRFLNLWFTITHFRGDNYRTFLCELSPHVAQKDTLVGLTYKLCKHCFVLTTNVYRWNPLEINSKLFTKQFCYEHSQICLCLCMYIFVALQK